jgi:hypothetical protein
MGMTAFMGLYLVSVLVAFVGWYACGPIPRRVPRCIARATLIAVPCAPGLLIGHGLGVAPTAYALYVQPSVFTLLSILVVWLIMLGVICAIPALREHRNSWPPSATEVFIRGYPLKFVLFGMFTVGLTAAALNFDDHLMTWVAVCSLFGGAAVNFVLCNRVAREKGAQPYLTPAWFAAPVLLGLVIELGFFWYAGGLAGALIGHGKQRLVSRISPFAMLPMAAVSLERAYSAWGAPSHVHIGGGVAGNLSLAAVYIALGAIGWWLFRRT